MRRTFGTEPLDDTIVTYAWDEGEFAQVEAYANSLPRAQPQAPDLSRWPQTPRTSPTTPVANGNFGTTLSATLGSSADITTFRAAIGHNSQTYSAASSTSPAAMATTAPVLVLDPKAGRAAARAAFEAIVDENLRCGLYLSQRNTLIAATRDPRCTRIHVRVLAEIIDRMNSKTGMAFPGYATIALDAAALPPGIDPPVDGYEPKYIRNIVSNLLQWGYLVSLQRGPEGGGRALAHYTVARPSVEDLQREVTEFVNKIRTRDRLNALLAERAGVTNAHDTRKEPGVTNAHDTRKSGVTCVPEAGVTCVTQTVTSKRGTSSKERANAPTLPLDTDAADPHKAQRRQPLKPLTRKRNGGAAETEIAAAALAAWNAVAVKHGFVQCRRALSSALTKRLVARVDDLGGLEPFERALSAIPQDAFLMGKTPPKPGQAPFRLDVEYLLSTGSKKGDVLGALLDKADATTTKAHRSAGVPPLDPQTVPPAAWRHFVKAFHDGGAWGPELGPPPGTKGCLIPPEILREFDCTAGASK